MTTGRTPTLLDDADSARFDDDGGVPIRPDVTPAATHAEPAPTGESRLSMARARGSDTFDGAWWPRTWRLARELPALIAALSARGEVPSRMSVNGDIWTDIPHRFPLPARPPLRISWYRTLDPHTVTLSSANRARVFLLVIPPDTAQEPAKEVRRMAAAGRLSGPSSQILRHAGAVPTGMTSSLRA